MVGDDTIHDYDPYLQKTERLARPRPARTTYAASRPRAAYMDVDQHRPASAFRPEVDLPSPGVHDVPIGASFLARVPKQLPGEVKVDDSYAFERAFLHPMRGFTKGVKRPNAVAKENLSNTHVFEVPSGALTPIPSGAGK